jgi:hypothetical protein
VNSREGGRVRRLNVEAFLRAQGYEPHWAPLREGQGVAALADGSKLYRRLEAGFSDARGDHHYIAVGPDRTLYKALEDEATPAYAATDENDVRLGAVLAKTFTDIEGEAKHISDLLPFSRGARREELRAWIDWSMEARPQPPLRGAVDRIENSAWLSAIGIRQPTAAHELRALQLFADELSNHGFLPERGEPGEPPVLARSHAAGRVERITWQFGDDGEPCYSTLTAECGYDVPDWPRPLAALLGTDLAVFGLQVEPRLPANTRPTVCEAFAKAFGREWDDGQTQRFAIARRTDGRAIMQGSHLCSVRWGTDPTRLLVHSSREEAVNALDALSDPGDKAYICDAEKWAARVRVPEVKRVFPGGTSRGSRTR